MISEFDGTSHKLPEFLSAASYAMKNTSPMEEEMLLKAILCTKLKGKAMTDFQTRDIRDFAQLKRELEVCYLSKKSTTHLQLEFNTLKQKNGESARAFGLHMDKLAMELYESMIEGRNNTIESKRAILETIQQQTIQHSMQFSARIARQYKAIGTITLYNAARHYRWRERRRKI
ncbi:hypothetical protein P5V15_001463 [Pogonomyrmex californicus]